MDGMESIYKFRSKNIMSVRFENSHGIEYLNLLAGKLHSIDFLFMEGFQIKKNIQNIAFSRYDWEWLYMIKLEIRNDKLQLSAIQAHK